MIVRKASRAYLVGLLAVLIGLTLAAWVASATGPRRTAQTASQASDVPAPEAATVNESAKRSVQVDTLTLELLKQMAASWGEESESSSANPGAQTTR
jgi:hypothetical protein